MKKIAITGGIAAGKSTVCDLFAQLYHVPIFDADKCVHGLYEHSDVAQAMQLIVPNCLNEAGQIDRHKLSKAININPDLLEEIEDFIHPLVRQSEQRFMQYKHRFGCEMIISDIPLLFEKGMQDNYDAVIIVHSPLWLRQKRAMKRTNMNAQKWRSIIANQMTDAERLKMANLETNFVINTNIGRAHMAEQVKQCFRLLHPRISDAGIHKN